MQRARHRHDAHRPSPFPALRRNAALDPRMARWAFLHSTGWCKVDRPRNLVVISVKPEIVSSYQRWPPPPPPRPPPPNPAAAEPAAESAAESAAEPSAIAAESAHPAHGGSSKPATGISTDPTHGSTAESAAHTAGHRHRPMPHRACPCRVRHTAHATAGHAHAASGARHSTARHTAHATAGHAHAASSASARHSTSLHTAHGTISPKTRARRHAAGVTPSQSSPSRLPKVARVGPRRSMHRGSGIDAIERGSERAVARGDARCPRDLPLTGSCPTNGPRDVAVTVARERIAVGMGGGRSLHPTS